MMLILKMEGIALEEDNVSYQASNLVPPTTLWTIITLHKDDTFPVFDILRDEDKKHTTKVLSLGSQKNFNGVLKTY